eukprot:jgi/Chlat1/3489/Chrsp23S03687
MATGLLGRVAAGIRTRAAAAAATVGAGGGGGNPDSLLGQDAPPGLGLCYGVLQRVSRPVGMLVDQQPQEIRIALCVLHLVTAALETIEDDSFLDSRSRLDLLRGLHARLDDTSWQIQCGHGAHAEIFDAWPSLAETFQQLPELYQKLIREAAQCIGAGMADFHESQAATVAKYDQYCRVTAGTAAVAALRLAVTADVEVPADSEYEQLVTALGMFAKKVRLAFECRSISHRLRWPQELCWQHLDNLEDLLEVDAHEQGVLKCLNSVALDALRHIPDVLTCLEALQDEAFLRLEAVQQVVAMHKLALCYNNVDCLHHRLLFRKGWTAQLVKEVNGMSDVLQHLAQSLTEFEAKVDADDSTARTAVSQLKELCKQRRKAQRGSMLRKSSSFLSLQNMRASLPDGPDTSSLAAFLWSLLTPAPSTPTKRVNSATVDTPIDPLQAAEDLLPMHDAVEAQPAEPTSSTSPTSSSSSSSDGDDDIFHDADNRTPRISIEGIYIADSGRSPKSPQAEGREGDSEWAHTIDANERLRLSQSAPASSSGRVWTPRWRGLWLRPPTLLGESALFSEDFPSFVAGALPSACLGRAWNLLYSTDHHGIALSTLYRKAPANGGAVFGGFAMGVRWEQHLHYRYQGSNDCFVFQQSPNTPRIYPSTGLNRFYVLCESHALAFGGGGRFAFRVDSDLDEGSSGDCDTYGSECLAASAEFRVRRLEMWGFDHVM